MVGNVINMPLRVVAPSVIRAANRITLHMLAADFSDDEHGTRIFSQVRTHVLAIGVQHHRVATLAAIKGEVTAKKGNANGPVIDLAAFSHDEPPTRVGVGS